MEYRRLGSLSVSLVGIGCNNFGWRTDAAGTAATVDAALDAGINFFDTADCYGAGQSDEFGPKIFTSENLESFEALIAFAQSRIHSLLELAFSWLAARPEVCSIIAGAKTPGQVRANSVAAS